jgi:hypothetical protein
MTNGNKVFDLAIHLMDEQYELTGATRTADTKEYEFRALSILNILRHELFPFSDTYDWGENGRRWICPELEDMEQPIDLDDAIAQGVMPYGLAAHLLLGENNTMASFFNQRYAELMYSIGTKRSAVWEDIIV